VDGVWKSLEPRPQAASEEQVRQFLSAVNSQQSVEYPDDRPSSLARYGLDRPRAVLEVWPTDKSQKSRALLVGAVRPSDKSLYVKERDKAYVVAASPGLTVLLEKKAVDFKSKDVMKFDEQAAVRLTLKGARRNVTYIKGADGSWQSPERPAAASEAPGLLAQLAATAILDFTAGPASGLGLDPPALSAEVGLSDGSVRTYRYGKRLKDDRIYLASDKDGEVYQVAAYVASQIEAYLAPAPPPAPSPAK
jgi:hypothetical protein